VINLAGKLIKLTETEHPLLCKDRGVPETEFFYQHGKRADPEIYKIQVNTDFFWCKGDFLIQGVVYMNHRNVNNMELFEKLKKEKFFDNSSKALEIRNKAGRTDENSGIGCERIE